MTDEQRRRGPAATQVEATGQSVQANVARLRKARSLTTYQLAKLLADAGRPIPQSGISRIESGARRVDVDDLMALAAVLNVSPSALLLPLDDAPTSNINITGAGSVPADVAWDWVDGERPLRLPEGASHTEALEYDLYSRPPRRRRSWAAMQDLITVTDPETRGGRLVNRLREEDSSDGSSVD
jgi:transcriptional regulator with XRE-family HTH domain